MYDHTTRSEPIMLSRNLRNLALRFSMCLEAAVRAFSTITFQELAEYGTTIFNVPGSCYINGILNCRTTMVCVRRSKILDRSVLLRDLDLLLLNLVEEGETTTGLVHDQLFVLLAAPSNTVTVHI